MAPEIADPAGELVADLDGLWFAVLVLAPLGLCLGAFMPLGLITVSRLSVHRGEYVAWGWALNGVFSVIGSILATILSMSYGFRTVLLVAAVVYVLACLSLWTTAHRMVHVYRQAKGASRDEKGQEEPGEPREGPPGDQG